MRKITLYGLLHTAIVTSIEYEVQDGQPLDPNKVYADFMESVSSADLSKLDWSLARVSDKPISIVESGEELPEEPPPGEPPKPSLIIHP